MTTSEQSIFETSYETRTGSTKRCGSVHLPDVRSRISQHAQAQFKHDHQDLCKVLVHSRFSFTVVAFMEAVTSNERVFAKT